MCIHIIYSPHYGKIYRYVPDLATWHGFTLGSHKTLYTQAVKFTSDISPTEIAFLDLIIYIKGNKLYTRLYTKNSDRLLYNSITL